MLIRSKMQIIIFYLTFCQKHYSFKNNKIKNIKSDLMKCPNLNIDDIALML